MREGARMWMTIFNAVSASDSEGSEAGAAPAHCPHPTDCLRQSSRESRSFCDQGSARAILLDRYRRLMAQQCACNDHFTDLKT